MFILEFAIDRTVIHRLDVDEEHFKDAIYHVTPAHLRETGLPFDKYNVLYSKQYVLALWKYFYLCDDPESHIYTGRFVDSLTVTNCSAIKYNYITKQKAAKRSASPPDDTATKKTRKNEQTILPG